MMRHMRNDAFAQLTAALGTTGILVGLVFPLVLTALGTPPRIAFAPSTRAWCVLAGIVVAGVGLVIVHGVVGRRVHALALGVENARARLAELAHGADAATCTMETCRITVASDDAFGTLAKGYNELLETFLAAHELSRLHSAFMAELTRSIEPAEIGAAVCRFSLSALGAQGAALVEQLHGTLEILWAEDLLLPRASEVGAISRAIATREIQLVERPWRAWVNPGIVADVAPWLVAAPATMRGASIGVLVLTLASAPAPGTLALLSRIADPLGVALTNARAHAELATLSAIDPLTETLNRRFGLARLEEEVARCARERTPLALIAIDVDRFKAVNDTWGHPVGDQVLREVAHRLASALREGDQLVRTGGEEFLAIVPGASIEDAIRIAERLRAHVGTRPTSTSAGELTVTISAGIAVASAIDRRAPNALIAAADAALYRAKAAGRDRIELAGAGV